MANENRDRTKAADKMAERRRADDKPTGWGDKEIGSGGQRTRADGVQVNGRDTNDDTGWNPSR